jgi:hypothetical protein
MALPLASACSLAARGIEATKTASTKNQWQLAGHSFRIRRFGPISGHNTPEQSQWNANPWALCIWDKAVA